MGWGGARQGSGPKKGPDGKALKPYGRKDATPQAVDSSRTPVIEAKVVQDRPRPMFSDSSVQAIVQAMQEMQSRTRNRPRTKAWNPYVIRPDRFGPVADHIKKRKKSLAMDSNSDLTSQNAFAVQAWQAGGLLTNNASDGLLFLGYPLLSDMLQRSEFRLFSEIMAEEMTRKWIDFRGTDDESTKEEDKPKERNADDEEADRRREREGEKPRDDGRNKEIERKILELKDFLDHLKLRQRAKEVAFHDSGFGIGHLYLDLKGANIDDIRDPENGMSIGNGRDEITKNKLGKGCLLGLRTIEPVWCYPTVYNASNPLSPTWYDPQVWYVMGAEIHKTRLIPFIGRPVPDLLKPAYSFGGLSMTQMAQPYVDIWLRTRESVGEIIHAFSVMILSTNMATTTQPGGAGGGGGDVIARMMLANMLRDNQGMVVIDKATEDFKNISAPISGLDELQAQSQEHMFSVGRIPAVKFAGIQPKGLNATSEGELQAFYATVHGKQEDLFRQGLTSILDIAQISLWGARDPDITYDFLALQEETPKEKAEIRKLEAETDQIRIDSGVVSQEEAREKLAADDESGYDGIDPDDVPDLLGEEEEGLIPEGAGKGLEAELAQGGAQPQKPPGAGRKPPAQASKGGGDDAAFDEAPRAAAGILHRAPDGTVLLLRRSQSEGNYRGHWALPGGGADEGETPEEAARRENEEEIGLSKFGPLKKINEIETPTGMRFHTFLHNTKKFTPELNDEHDGYMWAHPKRLPEPMHPAVKRVIGGMSFDGAFDDGQWEESKHKRDQGGKFTSGGGGGGAAAKTKPGKPEAGGKPPASSTGGMNAAPQKPLKKLDWKDFKKVGNKMGSNTGGTYESASGEKFYIKQPKGQAQVKNEIAAAKLYQLAGLNTFEYLDAGPSVVATKIEKLDKNNVSQLSPEERKQAQKDFITHAWLANWDAVGMGGDNIGVVDGKVKVLDTGGSLAYRAQGEPKGAAFGNKVMELDTLRDPDLNPDAAALYGNMTQAQLVESAKQVTEIPDNAIREIVKEAGESDELAEKLIERKKDIAATYQLKAAGATNPEWEALHPRGPGGKFASKGGAAEEPEEAAGAEGEEDIQKLLAKKPIAGSNYRKALSKALKSGKLTPEQTKIAASNLVASWQKTGENAFNKGDMDTAGKIKKKIDSLEAQYGLGKEAAKPAPEKPAAEPEPKPAPAPAPAPEPPKPVPPPKIAEVLPNMPKPTEQELAKAKKTAPLKMEYIGGEKPTEGVGLTAANKMIEIFNEKYAGKEITDPDELTQKVNHFKVMQVGINGLGKAEADAKKSESQKTAEKAVEAKAAQLKKEKEEKAAKHQKLMKDLKITDTEALGFEALVKMHGGDADALIAKFKYSGPKPESYHAISDFQYALMRDYINGGYHTINASLRSGYMSLAQHVYVKLMNDALEKVPKYTGEVKRGTTLSKAEIAKYQPGMVVQETSFTSTGAGFKFDGNVSFKIKAIGKRGADIREANGGESEILFKANTFFLVHKVEVKGGTTHIEMEEVEAYG